MNSCQHIESIDCELSVYRKGFLSVRLDLQRKLIIWKDSNHWSNNFIRSLTFSEVEQIRCALPDLCHGLNNCSCKLNSSGKAAAVLQAADVTAMEDDNKDISACTWQMILNRQDQQWCLQGHNPTAETWQKLAGTIEKISRLPIRL